jgi:hypothetical protein
MAISIYMTSDMHASILAHLFPKGDKREQGGFLFCKFDEKSQTFDSSEWLPLKGTDYAEQANDYLELADETRAMIIKKAHDMNASIVELHCHLGPSKATFSIADWLGFNEFVPHILWRLKNKPYAALVFAHNSVDGFTWLNRDAKPIAVTSIETELTQYPTTGLSINALNRGMYERF